MKLLPYYEDPQTLHVGTCPPRAYYLPAASAAAAGEPENNDRVLNLNGEWDFTYYSSRYEVPERFWEQASAGRLAVPSVWQHNGYDCPMYVCSRYPFPYDPPLVPYENPCGAYVRRFSLSAAQLTQRVFLDFEGVDSCCYVWLNGSFVGYDQVAHCTGEFEVGRFLREGENTLAVLVLKWCDGSYLEDQDKFRTSGIFRDVYLLFRPQEYLRDYTVRTKIDEKGQGVIQLQFSWSGQPQPLTCLVTGADGTELCRAKQAAAEECSLTLPGTVSLWNAEKPSLYTLLLCTDEEFIREKVGFRTVDAKDGILHINGQAIKFRGVNRHDSSPFTGPAVTREHARHDLELMKQHNINTIRTSHYPNAPWFTGLCDEYGFYVIAEADQETHGTVHAWNDAGHFGELSDDPRFRKAYEDRAEQMLERDKNRPCIVMWSAGNESGWGGNTAAELALFKRHDPTRLTHYESYWSSPAGATQDFFNLDVLSKMYPSPKDAEAYLEAPDTPKKPFFLCEYSHAMGNGPGDLEDYFQLFDAQPASCGGCIWEWCDHAVYDGKTESGKARFLYGNDWGEYPSDNNFCLDGLVYPDRRVHTGLKEYKNVIRPARIQRGPDGWTIRNILDFTDLSDYLTIRYELTVAGKQIVAGTLAVPPVPPHGCAALTVPDFGAQAPDTWVRFIYERKASARFAPAGQELGFDVFCLAPRAARTFEPQAGTIGVEEDECRIVLTGLHFRYSYNKHTGLFDRLEKDGRPLLDAPMQYNIWRAPTDNDVRDKKDWTDWNYDRMEPRCYRTALEHGEKTVLLKSRVALCAKVRRVFGTVDAEWTVDGAGQIGVRLTVKKDCALPAFPRFGIRMFLPKTLDLAEYLGWGPNESYIDKHRSSWYGLFTQRVEELHEDYLRPQENGSHWNCDRLTLSGSGTALCVSGLETPFSFNVSRYTQEMLAATTHNFELAESGHTVLCLDYRQNGIGSNSCGPRLARKYQLNDSEFTVSFRLEWN